MTSLVKKIVISRFVFSLFLQILTLNTWYDDSGMQNVQIIGLSFSLRMLVHFWNSELRQFFLVTFAFLLTWYCRCWGEVTKFTVSWTCTSRSPSPDEPTWTSWACPAFSALQTSANPSPSASDRTSSSQPWTWIRKCYCNRNWIYWNS